MNNGVYGGTPGTGGETALDSSDPACTAYVAWADPNNTGTVQIRIQALHGATSNSWFTLPTNGSPVPFRVGALGVNKVEFRGSDESQSVYGAPMVVAQ